MEVNISAGGLKRLQRLFPPWTMKWFSKTAKNFIPKAAFPLGFEQLACLE